MFIADVMSFFCRGRGGGYPKRGRQHQKFNDNRGSYYSERVLWTAVKDMPRRKIIAFKDF